VVRPYELYQLPLLEVEENRIRILYCSISLKIVTVKVNGSIKCLVHRSDL